MKRQKRTFLIDKDFINCINCQLNYSCHHVMNLPNGAEIPKEYRIFCQEYSTDINPKETKENNARALKCDYFFPTKVMRSKMSVDAPEHTRWYEELD